MADVKISGLPSSTTPLAGTEVLPIVQGGTTKKVASDDLTVKNVRSNASTGILQITGPSASSTRVMTTPDANFTIARTDAEQTFAGDQTLLNNLIVTGSITTSGGYKVPYTLIETGIPFVLTSGSMGNNGALTLTTAVATAYPNAYVYMPAGAIQVGSAAGWYYAVFSTTSAATIYNNTYSSGQPTIPASPTAFVTTGPGAFTFSTASSYSGVSVTLPANAMGINGSLEFIWTATANNSANAKFARALFGGQTPAGATAFTSQTLGRWNATVQNRGVANVQTTNGAQFSNGQISAANSTTAINTAANVTVAGNLFLNVSTSDVIVMESFKVIVYPS